MQYECRFCHTPMPKPRTGDKRRCMACRKDDAVYCTTSKHGARKVWACIFCCRHTAKATNPRKRICEHCGKPSAVWCFASSHEFKRWCANRLRERAGQIRDLRYQQPFAIDIADKRITEWIADAVYFEGEQRVAEDAKGFRTPEYKLKKKLVEALYPGLVIREARAR